MVLCVSITMSTMLLKQHSVIDVVFGLLLALTLDYAATALQSVPRKTQTPAGAVVNTKHPPACICRTGRGCFIVYGEERAFLLFPLQCIH